MKISIRLSILTILLALLLGISILITGVNYITGDVLLINSAKTSLYHASGKVREQITGNLEPLNSRASIAFTLLNENTIAPKYSEKFIKLLYALIYEQSGLSGAYWGDVDGNMYWVNKGDNNRFFEQYLFRKASGNRTVEKIYDANRNLLSTKTTPFVKADPRIRPWFKEAVAQKRIYWSFYSFLPIGGQQKQFGITAASPLYDAKHRLLGVIAIDILCESIIGFVKNLKGTENTIVFLVDNNQQLIAASSAKTGSVIGENIPKLSDLHLPWVDESFAIYKKNKTSPFIYTFKNKKYIATYEELPNVKIEPKWLIGVVLPIHDVIAPLQKGIFLSLIFAIILVSIGTFLAYVFSSKISNPIKQLAQDAELICQLKLEEIKQSISHIDEIAHIANAFMKMKSALQSFKRYIPFTLVKDLVSSGKIAEVGGERKELTLLFSDIENFTPLSEKMPPEDLMQYLSEYFQVMTKIIIDAGGTVDKYIGDSVMAFWGAPLDDSKHALHACQAVIQLHKALESLNEKWHIEGKPEIRTRFGINTGQLVIGNVGSDDRLSYTALGDVVNLASRLEGLNKIYGTYTIVGESTHNIVKNHFEFHLLDKVAVKGKTQGFGIYELLGASIEKSNLELEQYNREFLEAFNIYESGDWSHALELFNILIKKYPQNKIIKIYITRCENFITNPPQHWNGIWFMDVK